jgi:hypothetical protein
VPIPKTTHKKCWISDVTPCVLSLQTHAVAFTRKITKTNKKIMQTQSSINKNLSSVLESSHEASIVVEKSFIVSFYGKRKKK